MPLIKDDLVTHNFQVYPFESYIRIARVEQVNLFSKDMIVQFVDGETDEFSGDFIEGPETATCIVGSDDPATTYAPSCTVYGKGDIVAILILASGQKHAVSSMDLFNNVNRENFALVQGWALYDVLSGVLVDGLDDTTTPENSYLTFRKDHYVGLPYTYSKVTKITGDPTKRHVMRRMLDYFLSEQTHNMSVTTTDDPAWGWDTARSGPDNNPMRHIHDRLHKGKRVCGFPYVEDIDYTNDNATLANNITAYHSTEEDLKTGDPHPLLNGDVLRRYFEHATVVWWDDEEPTHVLLIGAYPAWAAVQYIVFAEVPVYSMTGRKFLEREVLDEDLETERPGDILQSWQRFGDQVRILHWIDRSQYIDFLVHDNDLNYSERMTKAAVAYLPTQTGNIKDFGILDGYGWASGAFLAGVNKVKKIVGTIDRTLKNFDEATEANGSRYDYEILHNDPSTTGNLDLWYVTRFEYEWNAGAPWERQTPVTPSREYNCYVDGVNSMERTIDFDYNCTNGYFVPDVDYGRILWDDSNSAWATNSQLIDNEFWHRTERNGGEVWTDHWRLRKGFGDPVQTNRFEGDSTQYIMMYADVEYDLFVMVKIVTHIESHLGTGPGWLFQETLGTHYQRHYGIVIFEGVEWTIWRYDIDLTHFPSIYNFFPWTADISIPIWPGTTSPVGPYSIDTNYNGGFCYDPIFDPWLGTLKTGYSTIGFGCPAPYFGPEGIQTWQVIKTDDYAQPDDLLKVSIDYENDSFCVIWDSFLQTDTPNNKTLYYPNGGNTLYSFLGETPHFTDQVVTDLIEL